jgi:hypothetical protein
MSQTNRLPRPVTGIALPFTFLKKYFYDEILYELTSRKRILLEKLLVTQLIMELFALHGIWKFLIYLGQSKYIRHSLFTIIDYYVFFTGSKGK